MTTLKWETNSLTTVGAWLSGDIICSLQFQAYNVSSRNCCRIEPTASLLQLDRLHDLYQRSMIMTHLTSQACLSARRAAQRGQGWPGKRRNAVRRTGRARRRPVREALRMVARVLTDTPYCHSMHLMVTRFLPENLPNRSDGS